MQSLIKCLALVLTLNSCSEIESITPESPRETPVVQSESTYSVVVEEDIIYAEGLSHQTWNSNSSIAIPLKLDVYTPGNSNENRPAFMFIHGGGFFGGSKRQSQIIDLANYYTSRGWVFISIDYRVKDDFGTIPSEWLDYSDILPDELVDQFLAIYPAQRDAKAALRWVIANANTYNINTDYITVGGGSAGAITAITLGISNQEDFRDEIESAIDPTILATNLDQTYKIQTIVDFWGSKVALDGLQGAYGHQRFDSNDPSLFIAHGTEDPTVPFSNAEELKEIYEATGVPLAYYPIEGAGHGPWNATVNGERLDKLAFDFITEQQALTVE
ncbi:MAG: alpha/beta hydrolase [Bacteroidota bacterium]